MNVRDRTELSHKHRTSSGPLRAAVYPIGSVALVQLLGSGGVLRHILWCWNAFDFGVLSRCLVSVEF